MNTSIFLAKLIGPFFLVLGVCLLVNAKSFRTIAEEFLRSRALLFLSGLLVLPVGLAIVLTHNVWVADWPVIITLLGWLCIFSGIIRLFAPQPALKAGRKLHHKPNVLIASASFWTVIGVALCFFGYFK